MRSDFDPYRVLVCGGRTYDHAWRVYEALELIWRFHNCKFVVIEGGASGADHAAYVWANDHAQNGVEHSPYPADWRKHGKSAGMIRNLEMLEHGRPDLVIAFPGGRGTRNMVSLARNANVSVCYGEDLESIKDHLESLSHAA